MSRSTDDTAAGNDQRTLRRSDQVCRGTDSRRIGERAI